MQENIKNYQRMLGKKPTGKLSAKYWQLFMRRHSNVIQTKKGYRMASNRSEWVTYNNVKTMYDLVYDQIGMTSQAQLRKRRIRIHEAARYRPPAQ